MKSAVAVQQAMDLRVELPMTDSAIEESPEMEIFALINGQPLRQMPQDLYIPPEALEVFLETFEGPLDLLLYLIKKQNLDILEIKVAEITRQYMNYVALMEAFQLELAAEYLVMAATLGEIKSRCLLPRPPGADEDEADPRQALIERLQNYERFKKAAEKLDHLPRCEREILPINLPRPLQAEMVEILPSVLLEDLLLAFKEVIERAGLYEHHRIAREPLSIRERMTRILAALQDQALLPFSAVFDVEEGRQGVVVSFIALLELIKGALIEIVQAELFAPIYLAAKSGTVISGAVISGTGADVSD
jgi:segregation and condensation protein A